MADANYEMVFAVLPLFLTAGIGALVYEVGLVEGASIGVTSFGALTRARTMIAWSWAAPAKRTSRLSAKCRKKVR